MKTYVPIERKKRICKEFEKVSPLKVKRIVFYLVFHLWQNEGSYASVEIANTFKLFLGNAVHCTDPVDKILMSDSTIVLFFSLHCANILYDGSWILKFLHITKLILASSLTINYSSSGYVFRRFITKFLIFLELFYSQESSEKHIWLWERENSVRVILRQVAMDWGVILSLLNTMILNYFSINELRPCNLKCLLGNLGSIMWI